MNARRIPETVQLHPQSLHAPRRTEPSQKLNEEKPRKILHRQAAF